MDIQAFNFMGEPVPYKAGIFFYPPTVKDVMCNPLYSAFEKVLTVTQEELWDELIQKEQEDYTISVTTAPTPFEYLMASCHSSPDFMSVTQGAFEFFLKEKVIISPSQKIILFERDLLKLSDEKEPTPQQLQSITRISSDDEFFDFQNQIRELLGKEKVERPNPNEDPYVTKIKAKGRMRERLKAKQNKGDGITMSAMLASLCCRGIGITPLNVGEISYFAAIKLSSMLQAKEEYEVAVRAKTTGFGASGDVPKHWITTF